MGIPIIGRLFSKKKTQDIISDDRKTIKDLERSFENKETKVKFKFEDYIEEIEQELKHYMNSKTPRELSKYSKLKGYDIKEFAQFMSLRLSKLVIFLEMIPEHIKELKKDEKKFEKRLKFKKKIKEYKNQYLDYTRNQQLKKRRILNIEDGNFENVFFDFKYQFDKIIKHLTKDSNFITKVNEYHIFWAQIAANGHIKSNYENVNIVKYMKELLFQDEKFIKKDHEFYVWHMKVLDFLYFKFKDFDRQFAYLN